MQRKGKNRLKAALAACVCGCALLLAASPAHAATAAYQLYPTPHDLKMGEGAQTLRSKATVVLEDGIDADTEARLNEALQLKGITPAKADKPSGKGATNVVVGVDGSNGAADKLVDELTASGELKYDKDLFKKTDAYLLASVPAKGNRGDSIVVLGKSTDAAFYGLTSLYQIFQQIDGAKLSAFTLQDYADVVTRGFIEGYYGNPWSTEDRVNLMNWGGYYKLNAYVYAPKDDPKHNAKWQELYTPEEIESKIKPLAAAGNESKCRFVFALHPFMSHPITKGNYDTYVPKMKAKFKQVIDAGVRQIAILADDAGNQGNDLYKLLLEDTTQWLHELQQEKNADGTLKYPGLKDTLIFCPVNYMGHGEEWYKDLPKNVQVVNTGGRVWGKIDKNFADAFKNTSGVSPFMWINWPCSDNDKDALHMGGHDNFLGSDLKPGQVEGVVLNPMQQSEPSKQGIFMNADFSWNLWKSTDHSAQVWEDSFSYVDHNSPVATKGSNALRELSNHMKRMYGGGATWINGESADVKDKLEGFRRKLDAGTVFDADIVEMVKVFSSLQKTAKDYRANAGNTAMAKQMEPWLDTWDDLTRAALEELAALKADLAGNTSELIARHSAGQQAFDAANNHGFHYVDHTERARVGKAYITPTVSALNAAVSERATLAVDPDADFTKFVTSRMDAPSGSLDSLFDGDVNTGVSYKDPATTKKDDFIGVEKAKPFDLDSFTVTYDAGHLNDTLRTAKLQVLRKDGKGAKTWSDVKDKTISNNKDKVVSFKDLNQKDVYGVRLIATADNSDACWLTVNELQINAAPAAEKGVFTGTVSLDKCVKADGDNQSASDNNPGSYLHIKRNNNDNTDLDRDHLPKDASITVTFSEPKTIDHIFFKQDARNGDASNSGDGIRTGKVQYKTEAKADWTDCGTVDGSATQNFDLKTPVKATAIRVVNGADTQSWWKVYELNASLDGKGGSKVSATVSLSDGMGHHESYSADKVVDGKDATCLWAKGTGGGQNIAAGNAVTITYDKPVSMGELRIVQGLKPNGQKGDALGAADIEVSTDGTKFDKVGKLTDANYQTVRFNERKVKAVRITATQNSNGWWVLNEVTAAPGPRADVDTNIENAGIEAVVAPGSVSLTDGTLNMAKDSHFYVDLGSIRSDVKINKGTTTLPEGVELVASQNKLEWTKLEPKAALNARYVGFRASKPANLSLKDFSVSFNGPVEPKSVGSTGNLGAFDATNIFDGDVTTAFKNGHNPSKGETVTFDLGRERTINSIAYYVPETSRDFIRNAVVEVSTSNDKDAKWTEVLKINGDNIVADTFNDDTAKSAAWLTHDSAHPGNMMTSNPKTKVNEANPNDPNGTEKLNEKARYVRIRFTGTYTHRWVEIGELQINNGEYVSNYVDADFEQSCDEAPYKVPSNLIDRDTKTAWAPSKDNGTLTYRVSTPMKDDQTKQPKQGVRILSVGEASNAKVKATVYTDDTFSKTAQVELGTLDRPLAEFGFEAAAARANAGFAAVKDITVEWKGAKPQISEIYLLDEGAAANKDTLAAKVKELEGTNTSAWTAMTAQAFADALKVARETLSNAHATQGAVDSAAAQLDAAAKSGVERYAATELQDLVNAHVSNDHGFYSSKTYRAYEDAYNDAVAALKDAQNLSKADGEKLARALKDAKAALGFDQAAAQRAEQMVADAHAIFDGGSYTADSRAAYDDALAKLEEFVSNKADDPAVLVPAMQALADAQDGLVDISALLAARAEFETFKPGNYTAESFAAYQQAFDASTPLLKNGSADAVAAAVKALNDAKGALVALDIDALIAECEKLNEADYTKASWDVFADALKAAKAGKDGDNAAVLAQALVDARGDLVNVVALKDAIARAEGVDLSGFTADSAAKVREAIAAGKSQLVDGTIESVEAARQAIADALKGLVSGGGSNGGSGQGGSGNTGGAGSNAGVSGGSGSSTGKQDGTLVQTGDIAAIAIVAAAGAGLCALGAAAVSRSRNHA